MNFETLNAFNECTLKQMIIDLHAENKKQKDSYNEKLDSKDKEISELIDIANERQMDVQLYKRKYEEIKNHNDEQKYLYYWIEFNLTEADNVTDLKGMSYAPTHFETLYDNYVEWCDEEIVKPQPKKFVKDNLLKWQEKSKYGLSIGKTKKDSEGMSNGYLKSPLFNLKIV
jgi:hypothetical protein